VNSDDDLGSIADERSGGFPAILFHVTNSSQVSSSRKDHLLEIRNINTCDESRFLMLEWHPNQIRSSSLIAMHHQAVILTLLLACATHVRGREAYILSQEDIVAVIPTSIDR